MQGERVSDCTIEYNQFLVDHGHTQQNGNGPQKEPSSCDSSVCRQSDDESHINFETHSTDIFPIEDRDRIVALAKQIRTQLLCRERPVEPGCVIKIPLSSFIRDCCNSCNRSTHIYGVVGQYHSFCRLTTARSYIVVFCLDNVNIPPNTIPLLHQPIYENEMTVVRYPDQTASLDDPNLDLLFHKVDGNWMSRKL